VTDRATTDLGFVARITFSDGSRREARAGSEMPKT
jgi:hypothetical protein